MLATTRGRILQAMGVKDRPSRLRAEIHIAAFNTSSRQIAIGMERRSGLCSKEMAQSLVGNLGWLEF